METPKQNDKAVALFKEHLPPHLAEICIKQHQHTVAALGEALWAKDPKNLSVALLNNIAWNNDFPWSTLASCCSMNDFNAEKFYEAHPEYAVPTGDVTSIDGNEDKGVTGDEPFVPEAEIDAHREAELSAASNAEDTRDTTTPIAAEELPSGMTDGLRFLRKKIEETQDQVNAVRREIRGLREQQTINADRWGLAIESISKLREQQTATSNQISTEFLRVDATLSKGSLANNLFRSDASRMLNQIIGLTVETDRRATNIYGVTMLIAVLVAIDIIINIISIFI